MNRHASIIFATILCLASACLAQARAAAPHPFEFHADANMELERFGPVERAYGYLNVQTGPGGDGTITVMFSNASDLSVAMFNARVSFLNAAGGLVDEENFACWIDAAGYREAIECKLSRALAVRDFESIEVDFYLSDIADDKAVGAAGVTGRAAYPGLVSSAAAGGASGSL